MRRCAMRLNTHSPGSYIANGVWRTRGAFVLARRAGVGSERLYRRCSGACWASVKAQACIRLREAPYREVDRTGCRVCVIQRNASAFRVRPVNLLVLRLP